MEELTGVGFVVQVGHLWFEELARSLVLHRVIRGLNQAIRLAAGSFVTRESHPVGPLHTIQLSSRPMGMSIRRVYCICLIWDNETVRV
jgi:hypothetical protein